MTLQERLATTDHQTIERALCHLAGMHSNLLFASCPEGEKQASARLLVNIALDVAGRDVCLPFSLDPAKASDLPVCNFPGSKGRGKHRSGK